MRIRSRTGLEALAAEGRTALRPPRPRIAVGLATCGLATGARAVYDALARGVSARRLDAALTPTGCLGCCQEEPLVDLRVPGRGRAVYARVTPEDVPDLLDCVAAGELPARRALAGLPEDGQPGDPAGFPPLSSLPFYRRQQRIVLRNCGLLDPTSLEEFAARGGYRGLARALFDLTPAEVVDEVLRSELRGRGGGGFPTGRKWQACREAPGPIRYVLCNADEGDPGAYMDRTVLESDPHSVVEGLALAAYAVGAAQGYVYIRNEYPLAVERVTLALATARERGLLGDGILGSSFSFEVEVVRGAGAFVCGEETALIASLEGGAGEPRPRPPYPAVSGLWGRPTVINNVKTLATVPEIVARGAAWHRGIGAPGNHGTVVFSLVGKVANTGLVEVPLGTTLRELVQEVGGGGLGGAPVKAVQTGGPSGGCLPAELFGFPVTYENLARAGSILGSGGLVVMDGGTCMVDVARYFLGFAVAESCGKCTPCREGTRALHDLLGRIVEGAGVPEDLERLEEVAGWVKAASLCGLGQTAPNPVLSTLRHFRGEYLAHVGGRRCPAGVCGALVRLRVEPALCSGCGSCGEVCPARAVLLEAESGTARIDTVVCTGCGACRQVCPTGAIAVEP